MNGACTLPDDKQTTPREDKETKDGESELWSDLIASKLAIKSKKRTKAKSMQTAADQ